MTLAVDLLSRPNLAGAFLSPGKFLFNNLTGYRQPGEYIGGFRVPLVP
jgi:hypothetical protein